jgi:hypothetical protein
MTFDDQDDELMFRLQFPKVTVQHGIHKRDGYLTEMSVKLLLVELRRNGFEIVKSKAT